MSMASANKSLRDAKFVPQKVYAGVKKSNPAANLCNASPESFDQDMRHGHAVHPQTDSNDNPRQPPACAIDGRVLIAVPELFIQRATFRKVHFSSKQCQCQWPSTCGRRAARTW